VDSDSKTKLCKHRSPSSTAATFYHAFYWPALDPIAIIILPVLHLRPLSSSTHFILNMEAARSSEILVTDPSLHSREDHDLNLHRRENLKSRI